MGICKCEYPIDLNKSQNEVSMKNSKNQTDSITQNNSDSQIIKNFLNLEDSIESNKENDTKIVHYLEKPEYEEFISKKVLNYIETHKLRYQDYLLSTINIFNTHKSMPAELKDGNIYCGNWNNTGEIEGYGILLIKDKNIVSEGIWEKGKIIYGRLFFPNGNIYKGQIKNSVPHGKGKVIFANNEIYKGDFIDGEMTGKGNFLFSDKTIYCGEIKKGFFNGEGSMKWKNGTEYHGNFKNSILYGKGKMFNDNNKEEYEGYFDKNEFHGNGIYKYQNDDIYEGNFEYGVKNGKGIYKRKEDNIEFDVIWKDDLPNGKGIVTYNDNKIKGFWRNGIIINKEITKQENNSILDKINFNIKPIKRKLYPSLLTHLSVNDNITSQYIMAT